MNTEISKKTWLEIKTLYNYLSQKNLIEYSNLFPDELVLLRFRGESDFSILVPAALADHAIKEIEKNNTHYCRDAIAK